MNRYIGTAERAVCPARSRDRQSSRFVCPGSRSFVPHTSRLCCRKLPCWSSPSLFRSHLLPHIVRACSTGCRSRPRRCGSFCRTDTIWTFGRSCLFGRRCKRFVGWLGSRSCMMRIWLGNSGKECERKSGWTCLTIRDVALYLFGNKLASFFFYESCFW